MEKEISISTVTNRTPVPAAPPNARQVVRPGQRPAAQKEISISAVQRQQRQPEEMKINLTNGNRRPPEEAGAPLGFSPTVKYEDPKPGQQMVAPKPVKSQTSRPSAPPQQREVRRIDPTQMIKPKQEEPQIAKEHIEAMAFDAFGQMIDRKKKEMTDALQKMEERDAINRAAVEEGLEQVKETIVYMDPEHEDPKYKENMAKRGTPVTESSTPEEDDDKFDDELERELNTMVKEVSGAPEAPTRNIRVMNATNAVVQSPVQIIGGMPSVQQLQQPTVTVTEEQEDTETQEYAQEVTEAYVPSEETQIPVEEDSVNTEVEESEPAPAVSPEEFDPTSCIVSDTPMPKEVTHPVKEDAPMTPTLGENSVKYVARNEEIQQAKKDITKTDFELDPDDFKDIEDESDDIEEEKLSKEEEELIKAGTQNLKNDILAKIVGAARRLDVTTFTVSKKTASLTEVLSKAKKNTQTKMTASWPLMNLGRPFIASALTGPEIVMLQSIDESNGNFWANLQQLTILYNHDENPYKPSTVEGWMKTIPYNDVDEIFMAIFYATYGNANYLPYDCADEKCHNMELQLVNDIKGRMVEFDNNTQKEKFDRIMNIPLTPENSIEYETVIVPINDSIAIGFKLPSLYNMIIELRAVNTKFVQKYASVITIMSYIDTIYSINADTQQFDRVDYKRYPGDAGKTFKSKIATYARILHTLTPNEFNVLSAYLNNLQGKTDVLKYVIPESKCTKCGATIEKRTASGKALVFTQQQLVTFATTIEE